MQIKTETKVGIFVLVALGLFVYMIFHLRVFRFHLTSYSNYEVCFENVAGLSEKSDVKIAGIKVGWVDKISLLRDQHARVRIMVKAQYKLYQNAAVAIRQEGLLGPRYVEVNPGDSSQAIIPSGTSLCHNGTCGMSMDVLLGQTKKLAESLTGVAASLNRAMGEGQAEKMRAIVDNVARASEKIAALSDSLNRVVGGNERELTEAVRDLSAFAREVKETLPQLRSDINRVTRRLDDEVLPAFKDSIERMSAQFETTADAIQKTLGTAQQGIGNLASVSSKIDSGQGLLGKLVNDEEMCNDIKTAAHGIRTNLAVLDHLGVTVDMHTETSARPTDCYCHANNTGWLNMRLTTSPTWFYALQLVRSERGWPKRLYEHTTYFKDNCVPMNPDQVVIDDGTVQVAPRTDRVFIRRNDSRLDIQVGKIFGHAVVRAGTIEGSFGFGLDYVLPFDIPYFKWVTGLEIYDIHGQNRMDCDRRPHLKWYNRMYLGGLYAIFGVDDFVSHCCRTGFFGAGLVFTDDDLKHVASKLGVLGMGS